MFHKVVVANRGAVAARVLRSLKTLNIRSVAVYSEADAGAPYLANADETYFIGPAAARESYLNQDRACDAGWSHACAGSGSIGALDHAYRTVACALW